MFSSHIWDILACHSIVHSHVHLPIAGRYNLRWLRKTIHDEACGWCWHRNDTVHYSIMSWIDGRDKMNRPFVPQMCLLVLITVHFFGLDLGRCEFGEKQWKSTKKRMDKVICLVWFYIVPTYYSYVVDRLWHLDAHRACTHTSQRNLLNDWPVLTYYPMNE